MTPEQQRLAIAEWVFENLEFEGYDDKEPKDPNRAAWFCKGSGDYGKSLPDFLNDLNAMHEAEEKLTYEQLRDYVNNLALVRMKTINRNDWDYVEFIHIPANERAEALLITIGKLV